MQELIYNLGLERIANEEIRSKRIITNLNKTEDLSEDEIIDSAIEKIMELKNINLKNYNKKVIIRDNQIGFYLNWHIDDCAIFKHKDSEGKKNCIKLNDKFSLFNLEELPKYTMIIYLTSNFTGGEFEFIDEKIKPKKYDIVFFDSREVHRVYRLREGERKNILIKFYETGT